LTHSSEGTKHVSFVCLIHIFLGGYCSTVQGLLDWYEVDLGFTELSFIRMSYSHIFKHRTSSVLLICGCILCSWMYSEFVDVFCVRGCILCSWMYSVFVDVFCVRGCILFCSSDMACILCCSFMNAFCVRGCILCSWMYSVLLI